MIDFFSKEKCFYHKSTKRYSFAFGRIFTNFHVLREVKGKEDVLVHIPIRYGMGNAYEKIAQDDAGREGGKVRMVVPAMEFHLKDLDYAPDRATSPWNRVQRSIPNTDQTVNNQFNRVPYNFNYTLMARTKTLDEMFNVIEQIVVTFNPSVTFKMKDISDKDMDVEHDVKVFLDNFQLNDNAQEQETTRVIDCTFNFTLQGYLYTQTLVNSTINEIIIIANVADADPFTLATYFEKDYQDALQLNSEHYQIVDIDLKKTTNMGAVESLTGNTPDPKRNSKLNN